MNVIKKVIAVIVIAVIFIRIFTIKAFAFVGAPVIAAEELTTLLETALVGMGLNADDLDGKDYNELMDEFKIQMSTTPNFNPKKTVVDDVISDFISDYEKLSDSVELTPTFDLNGHGGGYKMYQVDSLGNRFGDDQILYFDKLVIYRDSSGMATSAIAYLPQSEGGAISFGSGWAGSNKVLFELYGDVRYEDETPFETDEETLPLIGEADGTQVTPDMLNPDGTVTIDGTTYYPKDFIDWDKFKDPAIIDLLNQILDAIDNAPVVSEQDKPIVDVDSIEIVVPDELSDYTVPVGISSVFPFCLPFDFSRGIKILLAKPEV